MLHKPSSVNVEFDDEDNEEAAAEVVDRPDGWIFPGWMAYRMLGPRVHVDFRSPLFEVGD